MYGGQRTISTAIPRRLSFLFTETERQGFSLACYARLACQRAPEMCLSLPLSSVGILSMHHHADPCRCGFWALSSGLHAWVGSTLSMEPWLTLVWFLYTCAQLKGLEEEEDEDEDHDITGRKVISDKGAFWVRQLYKWQGERRECTFPIYSLYLYVFRSLLLFHIC